MTSSPVGVPVPRDWRDTSNSIDLGLPTTGPTEEGVLNETSGFKLTLACRSPGAVMMPPIDPFKEFLASELIPMLLCLDLFNVSLFHVK